MASGTWGTGSWGQNQWNDSADPTFTVTGIALSASLGDETTVGEINTGWGRLNWGDFGWGIAGIFALFIGVLADLIGLYTTFIIMAFSTIIGFVLAQFSPKLAKEIRKL